MLNKKDVIKMLSFSLGAVLLTLACFWDYKNDDAVLNLSLQRCWLYLYYGHHLNMHALADKDGDDEIKTGGTYKRERCTAHPRLHAPGNYFVVIRSVHSLRYIVAGKRHLKNLRTMEDVFDSENQLVYGTIAAQKTITK